MDSRFNPAVSATPLRGGQKKGFEARLGGPSNDKLTEWLASCPQMSLASYMRACMGKGGFPAAPWAQEDRPTTVRDIVSILCALGVFEPAAAERPGACDVVSVFQKGIELPPATIAPDGKIIPSEGKLATFCAPADKSLVIHRLRALPSNLTASESGEVFSKIMQVMGFSEGFCPPGEPAAGSDLGTFQNVEHIVLCPGSSYDIHARNYSPYSPALFHVHAEAWATC